jgi:hypothetical protein
VIADASLPELVDMLYDLTFWIVIGNEVRVAITGGGVIVGECGRGKDWCVRSLIAMALSNTVKGRPMKRTTMNEKKGKGSAVPLFAPG